MTERVMTYPSRSRMSVAVALVGALLTSPLVSAPAGAEELVSPPDAAGQPTLDESGSAVIQSGREGLTHVVEPVEGDVARILNVAEQSYSPDAKHEYAYRVALPEGVEMVTLADGTLAMVKDAGPQLDEAEAAQILAETLPEPELVDQADLVDNEAPAEMLGAAAAEVPEGKIVVGACQQPWAVDAAGNTLPTVVTVDQSGVVVQHVDTTGAVFPVVSDPLPIIGIALGAAARALAPRVARALTAQLRRECCQQSDHAPVGPRAEFCDTTPGGSEPASPLRCQDLRTGLGWPDQFGWSGHSHDREHNTLEGGR